MFTRNLLNTLIPTGLAVVTLSLLSGCASYPKAIEVPAPEQLPAFTTVQRDTDQLTGQTVVLGGAIVSVTNKASHSVVEVLQLPLFASGRPRSDKDASAGRFRVAFNQFLDPEIYASGRLLSVRGKVAGAEEGTIGEHPYRFITVDGDGLYLWPKQSDDVQVHYYMGINSYYPYPVYVRPRQPKQ
ncbi:Slp family lipoprotein [Thalassolituus sp. LLYu03]|uniref:Slp family lipoprotein n=1 Tax=Thalassolituus sp. LLYu03 TaxID=3421656 RepID=UPI003D269A6D